MALVAVTAPAARPGNHDDCQLTFKGSDVWPPVQVAGLPVRRCLRQMVPVPLDQGRTQHAVVSPDLAPLMTGMTLQVASWNRLQSNTIHFPATQAWTLSPTQ